MQPFCKFWICYTTSVFSKKYIRHTQIEGKDPDFYEWANPAPCEGKGFFPLLCLEGEISTLTAAADFPNLTKYYFKKWIIDP